MKKKLITLILCGVIGGTSIAGVSIYKMSQESKETQTLVNARETEEVDGKSNNNAEDIYKESDVERDNSKDNNLKTESGQVTENIQSDSKANNPIETTRESSVNNRQGSMKSTEQFKDSSVSNEVKDSTINNDFNNDFNNGSNNDHNSENNGESKNEGNSNEIITPPSQETGSFYDQVEQLIFNKVNEERAKEGVQALTYNSTMETYARIKSKDMGVRNYFDHVDPDGEMITAQMARDGVSYNAWGENIAYIGGVTDPVALANQFMTNWMNSPGHRANILSTNFTSIGIGVYKSGNKYYATQEFYK